MIKIAKKEVFNEDLVQNWIRQLRKGSLELVILSYIEKKDEKTYGYEIIKNLKEGGIAAEGNTVYPILRRLENNGLIKSQWITRDNQPKKFFRITSKGSSILIEIKDAWNEYYEKINKFLEK